MKSGCLGVLRRANYALQKSMIDRKVDRVTDGVCTVEYAPRVVGLEERIPLKFGVSLNIYIRNNIFNKLSQLCTYSESVRKPNTDTVTGALSAQHNLWCNMRTQRSSRI